VLQIYSSVLFRANRSAPQDEEKIFKHEIREVKGSIEDKLLHSVVQKHCR